jgi:DNA polymerase-1
MKKRFFIIDGSALAYRSYFAFINNPLRDSKGENTSAVYGFTSFLLKILKEENPPYITVCFDPPTPTFRHKMYSAYKATREKIPPDMKNQIPMIREVTEALGIPLLEVDEFEADDVMGTLAKGAKEKGLEAILVSSDKDFFQLVNESIKIYNPGRGGKGEGIYGREEVIEKYGVPPEKITDLFGLIGDKVDNVPGVKGVGMKTAIQLLNSFGSLEEVIQNAESIPQKNLKEKILTSVKMALLSKNLVTIRTDVPVDLDLDTYSYTGGDENLLRKLYKRLEFYALLKEMEGSTSIKVDEKCIESESEVKSLCRDLKKQKGFAIAYHQGTLEDADITYLSFSYDEGKSISISVKNSMSASEIISLLRPVLEDESIWKVNDDFKSLFHFLDQNTIPKSSNHLPVKGSLFDTSVASYLLNPSKRNHSLAGQVYRIFPLLTIGGSAGDKSSILVKLKGVMEEELEKDDMSDLFWNIEMQLVPVLYKMERNGVLIDQTFFKEKSEWLSHEIQKIEKEIFKMAGGEFNIRSPKQLREVLFEKLKLPKSKRTKTGYSTAVDVLENLSSHHELPRRILDYRELFKLKSTYVDVLPQLIHPETRRVHTTFDQTVAATGRLSSRDPNLQNVPMRTELGREIRKGFIAPDGWQILSADYSQIELRILGHLSGDETLINAFQKGEDFHTETASMVFEVPIDEMTPEVRNHAKAINYGIVYGLSSYGLSQQLDISIEDAASFIEAYFSSYPMIKAWIDQEVEIARERGYTKTLLNRRRYMPEIRSRNKDEREFGERIAMNSPIQGTAADMIKVAMIEVDREIQRRNLKSKMILQIHDELVFEVPEDEIEEVSHLAQDTMSKALSLNLPVVVDIGVGANWYEAH